MLLFLEETKTVLHAKIEQKCKEFHFCCLMSSCNKNMREEREVAVMGALANGGGGR